MSLTKQNADFLFGAKILGLLFKFQVFAWF